MKIIFKEITQKSQFFFYLSFAKNQIFLFFENLNFSKISIFENINNLKISILKRKTFFFFENLYLKISIVRKFPFCFKISIFRKFRFSKIPFFLKISKSLLLENHENLNFWKIRKIPFFKKKSHFFFLNLSYLKIIILENLNF